MKVEEQNLCQAIIVYLGFGKSASPRHDRDGIIDMFGLELLEKVLYIIDEVERFEVDWSNNLTLDAAGNLVRSQMQKLYPELNDEALNAIAWKYTYDWR